MWWTRASQRVWEADRDEPSEGRRDPAGGVQPKAGAAAGHGDVRAGCRHVDHERLDLRRGGRHRRDRQRPPVDNRPRGAGIRGLYPDRRQDRRPDRAQARLRHWAFLLRRRRRGDDARPDSPPGDHLLGPDRRPWRLAAPSRHAVAHPRKFRGRCPAPGLRPGRRVGRDRRRRRASARGLPHHVPVLARRLPARGPHHRGRPVRNQARQRRAVHRAPGTGYLRVTSVHRRHGRRRARNPGLAGRRRGSGRTPGRGCRRTGRPGLLAPSAQTPQQADAAGPGPVPSKSLPLWCHGTNAPADRPGRHHDRAAHLPSDGARIQRDAVRAVDRAALADHVRCRHSRREEGRERAARPASSVGASCS